MQVGGDFAIVEHIAEGLAIGFRPGQGAAQVAAAGRAFKGFRAAGKREFAGAFADLACMVVDGFIR